MNRQRGLYLLAGLIFFVIIVVLLKTTKKASFFGLSPSGSDEVISEAKLAPTQTRAALGTTETASDSVLESSHSKTLSEKAKADFTELTKAEIKFPENYRFQSLDLEFDNIAGMYADTGKVQVAVLAGRVLATDKELIDFLRDGDSGIPNVDGKGFSFKGGPVVAEAIPGSGLKSGKYWSGRTRDGKGVRVGMVQREDGKGSYLFVFTGAEETLDNSDDLFDDVYKNLKALPE